MFVYYTKEIQANRKCNMWQHVCPVLPLGLFHCLLQMRSEHERVFSKRSKQSMTAKDEAFYPATVLHKCHTWILTAACHRHRNYRVLHLLPAELTLCLELFNFWTLILCIDWVSPSWGRPQWAIYTHGLKCVKELRGVHLYAKPRTVYDSIVITFREADNCHPTSSQVGSALYGNNMYSMSFVIM